jgi:DNA-binding NarL/FixJ family response regulator
MIMKKLDLNAEQKKPLSIYFREDWQTYITPAMVEKIREHSRFDIYYCSNWDELDRALERNPHQLIFHIAMLNRLNITIPEIMNMLDTRLKLSSTSIPIAVGIDPGVTVSTVKELKRSGVFGIIPSAKHWGIEETLEAMTALADRVPYWPKHIIEQLPGQPAQAKIQRSGLVTLTVRQQEVMDLICRRGLSNKQIAKTLNLSESTVKIHVSAVMRAHGVRNRTQLALTAGAGLQA